MEEFRLVIDIATLIFLIYSMAMISTIKDTLKNKK
jgi:hypothetical protein